ncbi:disks large-associated protein 5 [Mantella aurantiaca]
MDIKSQFAGRYKTDMSLDNLRAKVARRKSILQKENRHKEFRKSRGLALVDANISVVKEQELTVLEEVTETFHVKGSINKTAVPVKNAGNISRARRAMLQRFQEEKQLRKLKEQRETANKGVFRCGIYKPETSFIPVLPSKAAAISQNAAKVKPKEKPAPPAVTRVTRSAAKIEAPVHNTRSRPAQVLNKVSDRAVPKGRGQASVLKTNDKENKVSAIPSLRTTRATAAATSRLPAAKGPVKNTSAVVPSKPQKRTKENSKQETVLTKPEPAVLCKEQTEKLKPEVTIEDQVTPEVAIEEKVAPEITIEEKVAPEITIEEKVAPEITIEEKVAPEITIEEKVVPEITIEEKVAPEITIEEKVAPEITIEEKVAPEITIEEKVAPEITIEEKVAPEITIEEKVVPEITIEEKVAPEITIEEKVAPEITIEEKVAPEITIEEKVAPEITIEEKVAPEITIEEKVAPEITIEEKVAPEITIEEKVAPEITVEVTAVESVMPAKMETSVREERKPSFAPENFVFQPMDGLSTFKFQPMTPKRANAFLTPTFTWSPVDGKSKFVFTRGPEIEVNKTPQLSLPDLSPNAMNDEMDTCDSPEAKGDDGATLPVIEQGPPACSPTDNPVQSDETHDVPYFRDLLKSEIQRLTLLCSEWDTKIEQDIPEDAKDLIRTTVGQTRLLLTDRFKQFEGLVDNCEFKRGEKETTCTDLDGFWDMIYFQIKDVSKKFVNLEKLEENSWQQTAVKAKKVVRKKAVPAATVEKSQGDNGRAAARSRLAAIKAAMRNGVKQKEVVEEASVSEQPMQVDPVVFDAGFFRVESPAKLPGSRRKFETSSQASDTPKSTKKILKYSDNPVIDTEKGEDCIQQNSDNPAIDHTEDGADHVQKSPSPAKSPVRKALFDTVEESLQNHQEAPSVLISSENTESEIVPQVDLTKYLVPTTAMTENVADSPGFMECSRLETGGTELDEDTKFEFTGTMVDDVFMCSPEKVQETTIPSPKDGTIESLPCEDLKNCDNPLDFLGDCASNMVTHTPTKSESVAAVSDLMVFSPMEF